MKFRIPWLANILAIIGVASTPPQKHPAMVLTNRKARPAREPLSYRPAGGEGYKRSAALWALMRAERAKFAAYYKARAALKRERRALRNIMQQSRTERGREEARARMADHA